MESFFSTLKTERLSKRQYKNRDELRADVFDYIERFYNPRRRHLTLGYISPVQYENLKRLAGSVRQIVGSPCKTRQFSGLATRDAAANGRDQPEAADRYSFSAAEVSVE
jgi:hypothetical protein